MLAVTILACPACLFATMYGISTGTVSNIIKEYEEALAIVDLGPIRKDLKDIHKHGFSVKDCAEASRFLNLLKEFYEREDLRHSNDFMKFFKKIVVFITDLYKLCTENGISPDIIPTWIKDLQDFFPNLRALTNNQVENISLSDISVDSATAPLSKKLTRDRKIPFISVVSSYIEISKKECMKLQVQEHNLKETITWLKLKEKALRSRLDQVYSDEKQIMQYLNWYCRLGAELNDPTGAQIDDFNLFAKAMNELAKRGYDANYILSELKTLQKAQVKTIDLESKIEKLEAKEAGLESSIRFYENRISEYNERMPMLDHLANIGFGDYQFSWIIRIIEGIARKEKIPLREAVNKFLKATEDQYFNW